MNDYIQQKFFNEISIDTLKIHSQIGRGAFSRVFSAYTPNFQRKAIKRIRLTAKPTNLLKEINFLQQFGNNINIIQIQDVIFSETTLQTSLVLSNFDGDDFKPAMVYYTPRDLQAYAFSLLKAISYTEESIVHRDVKPGNFLYSKKLKRGVLIDFGLAQELQSIDNSLFAGDSKKSFSTPHHELLNNIQYNNSQFLKPQIGKSFYPVQQTGQQALPHRPRAGTHGYRAPEVLFPLSQTPKVDIFSVFSSILQIFLSKTSIFRSQNQSDSDEISAFHSFFGSSRILQIGAGMSFKGFPASVGVSLEELGAWYNSELLVSCSWELIDLVRKCGEIDWKKRGTAKELLQHKCFLRPEKDFFIFELGAKNSILSNLEYNNINNFNCKILQGRMSDICCELFNVDEGLIGKMFSGFEASNYQQIAIPVSTRKFVEKMGQKHKRERQQVFDWVLKGKRGKVIFELPRLARSIFSQNNGVFEQLEYQERFLRARRLSAPRRAVDYQCEVISSLICEFRKQAQGVRKLAMQYRREVIKMGLCKVVKQVGAEQVQTQEVKVACKSDVLSKLKYGIQHKKNMVKPVNQHDNDQKIREIIVLQEKINLNYSKIAYLNDKISEQDEPRQDVIHLQQLCLIQSRLEESLQQLLLTIKCEKKVDVNLEDQISCLPPKQQDIVLRSFSQQFLVKFFTSPHLAKDIKNFEFYDAVDVKNLILAASCVQNYLDNNIQRSLDISRIMPVICGQRKRSSSQSLNIPKSGQIGSILDNEKCKARRVNISNYIQKGIKNVESLNTPKGEIMKEQAKKQDILLKVRKFETILAEISSKHSFAQKILDIAQQNGSQNTYQEIQFNLRQLQIRKQILKYTK